jgi:hypothetical protein
VTSWCGEISSEIDAGEIDAVGTEPVSFRDPFDIETMCVVGVVAVVA